MTPPMYVRVRDLLFDSGLCDGFVVQRLIWKDTGNSNDKFIVFRPNGGSAIRNDLSSDYYVMVDVIGAVDRNQDADDAANAILDFVQKYPMPSDCIGHIENLGGCPAPVLTTEGRLVYRLQFAIKYGE